MLGDQIIQKLELADAVIDIHYNEKRRKEWRMGIFFYNGTENDLRPQYAQAISENYEDVIVEAYNEYLRIKE